MEMDRLREEDAVKEEGKRGGRAAEARREKSKETGRGRGGMSQKGGAIGCNLKVYSKFTHKADASGNITRLRCSNQSLLWFPRT